MSHDKRDATPNEKTTTESTEKHRIGFENLVGLFEQTQTAMRTQAARSVDIALVVRNWLFGWYIVEFEDGGAERSELYGKALIDRLSEKLKKGGIKGMSPTNLRKFREFYQTYKEIQQTLSVISPNTLSKKIQQTLSVKSIERETSPTSSDQLGKSATTSRIFVQNPEFRLTINEIWQTLSAELSLSWSHYVVLLTIKSTDERRFYEIEAQGNSWSIRELKRQIGSSLYERLALSRDKDKVKELSEKGQLISQPEDVLKSPYVLEFLELEERHHYSENDLETAIIDKIEHFLLELGKGFLFEARQKRFTFDDDHFYVDLVFYNRLLRCYVLIDLKRDKLSHQDLGQMQMYVNFFDRFVKLESEAPTVGIVLCHQKNNAVVELTLPENSNIHTSEYQLYLPSKEDLLKQLEAAHDNLESKHGVRK